MFCPNCGAEERSQSQYCRNCRTEIHLVRSVLERPDAITTSAISAREDIGRAIAAKIKELQTAKNLKNIVEDVLPQIDKFLESPEERRLRGIREGVITSAVGLGLVLGFMAVSMATKAVGFIIASGGGLLVFLIGLGMLINAYLFTVVSGKPRKDSGRVTAEIASREVAAPDELASSQRNNQPSITEGTTRQLG